MRSRRTGRDRDGNSLGCSRNISSFIRRVDRIELRYEIVRSKPNRVDAIRPDIGAVRRTFCILISWPVT